MPALSELQSYTFVSRYARWDKEKKRRETWKEANDRVRSMMLRKYPEVEEEINFAYDMMYQKKILGSQRALQFGGAPAEKINARIYNCVSSYCDRLRFFQECLWLLLCGCGAGFSVQKHHIQKLPKFCSAKIKKTEIKRKKFTVPDSIEGWGDALGILLSSYFDDPVFPEYYAANVSFDYSKIRPKGAMLSSGVGRAPGPDGLKNALSKIRVLLDRCIRDGRKRLRPVDAYDVIMHSADAVLSGGVRRSATIAIFSPEDEEMARAKTGDWFSENPQRGRSNNSALLLRDKITTEEFSNLMECVKEFGEPGFIWSDSTEMTVNPCVEIGMYPVDTETGESGWQGCNLTTINCATILDKEDFYERCRAASILGTLQAGFTDFEYLGETSEKIFRKESLLGVSMTGTMERFEIVLNPQMQKEGAKIINQTNKSLAKKIGITPAARTTCLKPEGSSSCMLGTSSGIHPHHAKRYIRRVQANTEEAPYRYFKTINPEACEPSVWSVNKTDDIITFPVEVPDGAKTKNQLPALELLKIVKSTQQNWVMVGKNKGLCTKDWLNHNVSNTINVRENEWDEVEKFIYENRKYFCGISLIPQSGDKDYQQAPMVTVYTSREIVRNYGEAAIWCSGLIVLGLQNYGNNLWDACEAILKGVEAEEEPEKKHFIKRCQKFANKYFERDYKKLSYCLKDVYNWKIYSDLTRTFKKVDYTKVTETEDNTAAEQEWACSGGSCEVDFDITNNGKKKT